jgi:hypothetical protein
VAFRVDADHFFRFLATSADWRQPPFTRRDVVDHDKAVSVYFPDPYGNRLEVTSYDYAEIASKF